MVVMVALVLTRIIDDKEDPSAEIIWQNPRTYFTKFCRPIQFEFIKESKEVISSKIGNVVSQIENLKPTNISLSAGNNVINVKHKLLCTMVDG